MKIVDIYLSCWLHAVQSNLARTQVDDGMLVMTCVELLLLYATFARLI